MSMLKSHSLTLTLSHSHTLILTAFDPYILIYQSTFSRPTAFDPYILIYLQSMAILTPMQENYTRGQYIHCEINLLLA